MSALHDLREQNPSVLQFLAFKLGKLTDSLGKGIEAQKRLTLVRFIWHAIAFAAAIRAGFIAHEIAGYLVIAVSCLWMSVLTTEKPDAKTVVRR